MDVYDAETPEVAVLGAEWPVDEGDLLDQLGARLSIAPR
jgi:hypothetical protein